MLRLRPRPCPARINAFASIFLELSCSWPIYLCQIPTYQPDTHWSISLRNIYIFYTIVQLSASVPPQGLWKRNSLVNTTVKQTQTTRSNLASSTRAAAAASQRSNASSQAAGAYKACPKLRDASQAFTWNGATMTVSRAHTLSRMLREWQIIKILWP